MTGQTTKRQINYDLEEQTARFAEQIVDFVKMLPRNEINRIFIQQLIRAASSIGANYCEALDAESKKDFEDKIGICKKESRETKYWLRIVTRVNPSMKAKTRQLWQEAHELNLIFASTIRTSKQKRNTRVRH